MCERGEDGSKEDGGSRKRGEDGESGDVLRRSEEGGREGVKGNGETGSKGETK